MGRLQVIWHLIDTCLEAGVLWILYIEFNYDRIQDEKREYKEAQKKRKKGKSVDTPQVPGSGDKKDVAVEPGAETSAKEGSSPPSLVEMCIVCQRVHENPICFQERS